MTQLSRITNFNIAGVVLSLLYGIFGSSGGETTIGIASVGVLTVIMSFALSFLQLDLFKSKWYWFLILSIIGIAEASIVDWETIYRIFISP